MNHQRPFALRSILCAALLLALSSLPIAAQSATATLSGTVVDQNGAVVPGATVTIINNATLLKRDSVTNGEGSFTVPLLQPGNYTVRAQHDGFRIAQIDNLILNVGDQKTSQIPLQTGDVSETVNVTGEAPLIDTSPAVGTVVDRQFVQNIPLNGRSFQSLLELTPGVIITPGGSSGAQFSVNGQRTSANYVMVDGVGANTGILSTGGGNAGQGASGQLPGFTASGTTANLVSVDALQEFRIQTSSYAPEFGRQPGGQVSLVTRSGGNDFHGTAFDYIRNEVFDANDWFANRNGLRKPPTRQHLFGGTFSGPLYLPNFGEGGKGFYNGKNRTFFFFSYEGLRLKLPKALEISVPTLCLRGITCTTVAQGAALPQFQEFLRAFPIPNGTSTGPGFARFAASYSDPSRYDATSLRIDHSVSKFTFFGRFSRTPSSSTTRGPALSFTQNSTQNNTTITAGSTWTISKRTVNDLRVNYTANDAPFTFELDDFGGAVPLQNFGFVGRSPNTGYLLMFASGLPAPTTVLSLNWGRPTSFTQRQFNIVDNVLMTAGDHQLKFGVDFRRSHPHLLLGGSSGFETLQVTLPQLSSGQVQLYQNISFDEQPHAVAFDNLSLYAQDAWRVNGRLTLTYGIRWEFVPPPHATEGPDAITLDGLDNPLAPNNLSVAPLGTPLWKTRYFNFAPRFGASFLLVEKPGRQLVVRGGAGIFYDLGLGNSAEGFALNWPNSSNVNYPIANHPDPACRAPLAFPLPPCSLVVPTLGSGSPNGLNIVDREVILPRTYQWNFSAEQSLGANQTITISYVGAAGRELLSQSSFFSTRLRGINYVGAATTTLQLQRNLGYSNYEALQVQFQRRLSRGFQGLVAYTFGRSRDTESSDSAGVPIEAVRPETQYGNSSFDVRHNLTAAMTYQIPSFEENSVLKTVTRDWGVDVMFRARTGFPVSVTTSIPFPPLPGNLAVSPNVVPGQPFWIDDPNAPAGRRLNLLAFSRPANGTVGDLPKGVIRGFGAKQIDISLRREFPLFEKVRLQLRFEAFNVLNWPLFANPGGSFSASTQPQNFGASTQMLNRSLGGLNALYQIGGPRSMQGAVRISF